MGGVPPSAEAADTAKVGLCLLKECQKELAACVLNPKCLANVICLNTCNDRPDEAECQIKCGDSFENEVVGTFNACAVSAKKCVPQKQDDGSYPLPAPESMVKKFDTTMWNGRWYISAGLNKIFDTFDCQVHFFTSPYPGKFYAKLFWRINEPDGEFFTKDAVQRFVQDPKNPAHLVNHDNEYLHYKDDWYVLDYDDSKDDGFVLVYYRGSNDAWDGYGGAFLYSRKPTVSPKIIPRLEAAMDRSGLPYKWADFTMTDNTCKEQTESSTLLRERYASKVLITEEKVLQEQLTAARTAAVNTVEKDEKVAEKAVLKLEKELEKYLEELGAEVVNDSKALERELEKDVLGLEKELEKDLTGIEREIEKDLGLGRNKKSKKESVP
jgi:violaxanthin de-epoxidase